MDCAAKGDEVGQACQLEACELLGVMQCWLEHGNEVRPYREPRMEQRQSLYKKKTMLWMKGQ